MSALLEAAGLFLEIDSSFNALLEGREYMAWLEEWERRLANLRLTYRDVAAAAPADPT